MAFDQCASSLVSLSSSCERAYKHTPMGLSRARTQIQESLDRRCDGPHSEAAHFKAPFETLLHLRFVPSIIILILSRCFFAVISPSLPGPFTARSVPPNIQAAIIFKPSRNPFFRARSQTGPKLQNRGTVELPGPAGSFCGAIMTFIVGV